MAVAETLTVRMGEMDAVNDDRQLKTVLGSCVGVILRDLERRVSGLAHVMLPANTRGDATAGKYADTAIPALLARVVSAGARQSSLQALLVGGAQMFPSGNQVIASIGDQNLEASRAILGRCCIPIVFEDTGGESGRTVIYDNASGQISVRTLHALQRKGENP